MRSQTFWVTFVHNRSTENLVVIYIATEILTTTVMKNEVTRGPNPDAEVVPYNSHAQNVSNSS